MDRTTPRPPQGPELERLARAFRDNPRSAVFVPLAQGYLAAGRTSDAIDVLGQGLATYPDHTEGRLTLARAHVALSAWKDAEQELVKVVKLDRYHQRAFALLGEVLVRRENYDVALKALQRAVDLDPTDEHAEQLLARARARRPIDFEEDAATVVRAPDLAAMEEPARDTVPQGVASLRLPEPAPKPRRPAPPANGAAPGALPSLRGARADRPDDFLNALLGSGEAVREDPPLFADDGVPVRRWGWGNARLLLWLWVFLGASAVAGGGSIFLWFRARDAAVARHLSEARTRMFVGAAADFVAAEHEATAAVKRHPRNPEALATRAAARAVPYFLYGAGEREDVETSIIAAKSLLTPEAGEKLDPAAPGRRELIIAQAAYALARADRGVDRSELTKTRPILDEALARWPSDLTLRWLDGHYRWQAGDLTAARAALVVADGSGAGPPAARLALADLDLDEGNLAAATAGYDAVLARVPQHPLAVAGRALTRAEAPGGTQAGWQQLLAEVAPANAELPGLRAEGWMRLAVATLYVRLGHTEQALAEIDGARATGVAEPRFLWRVALLQLSQGKYEDAFTSRQRIARRGNEPTLALIDGELLLAAGRADEALASLGDMKGVRAQVARGRALLLLSRPAEALQQLSTALSAAEQDAAARGWIEVARAAAEPASGGPAVAALEKQVKDGVVGATVLVGEAQLARGETGAARRAYETAAAEASPLQYLALYRLAALALESGKHDEAVRQARAALVLSPGHLPSHSVLGRALWASGNADEAAPELQLVQNTGRAGAEDEIAFAQALAAAGDVSAAKAALIRARQKGADEGLVAKIEANMGSAPAPKSAPPPRRRGRR